MFASVFPLTRTRAFVRPFDYSVPADLAADVQVGTIVAAPLGSQVVLGLVTGLAATTAHEGRIVPLRAVIDLPPVPAELIDLAIRVHEHYLCPLGGALALVSPPASALRLQRTLHLTAAGRQALDEGHPELEDFALPGGLPVGGRVPPEAAGLRRRGLLEMRYEVRVVQGERQVRCLLRGPFTPARLGQRQRAALRLLDEGPCDEPVLRGETGISAAGLRRLLDADAVRVAAPVVDESPAPCAADLPALLEEQLEALCAAREAAASGGELLINGVTGSGKTEVYLRAAEEVLAAGRSVIVLVPEIGLTGQTVARLRARFPGHPPAVIHSSLPTGERLRAYSSCASGAARLVVGARSAVFAPVLNLGLIIVDEEHDDSYKQGSEPRYDARTVARWRVHAAGAGLLLGSATPSVDAWATVPRHVRLTRRVDGSQPPSLEVIDLRGSHEVLSDELRAALLTCVERGEKAILFLNRRGLAAFVSCGHCGHVWNCPACDVAFGLFRRGTELRCRVCGAQRPAPKLCPECASLDVGRHGIGTERLEADVQALLPGVELLRLDSDVASSLIRLRAVLDRFAAPGPRVLVGTQMVAKGHHFPDVTLVGVVNADLALHFPDYRSEERTFAMLVQVGGRSGRGERPGRAIVQTYDPEARPIALAASAAMDQFYEEELERRGELRYPPASTLIAVETSHPEAQRAMAAGRRAAQGLRRTLVRGEEIIGPGPLWRERSRYYCRSVVKTACAGETIRMLRPVIADQRFSEQGVRLVVDVEPSRL